MCSPGPSFWSANVFRNTVKIIPLSFIQHMHAKKDSLKSEHPCGCCGDVCVISYLLVWDGKTGSIYGQEKTKKKKKKGIIN